MNRTLKVGIANYDDMKARTMAIAQGKIKPSRSDPKVWFRSLESLAKVLSERNQALLELIATAKPSSLAELEEISGRAKSNLSRTLRTMEKYGLVELSTGKDRTLVPRVTYNRIQLEVPLGHRESVGAQRNRGV